MKALYPVLIKTLVVSFYRRNTGFFFVMLAFAVGVLRSIEHYYIIMAALHAYSLLGWLAILWTLYLIKTINFTWAALAEKPNQFLYQLYLYPPGYKVMGLLLVHLLQFLPVILYVGVMMALGVAHHRLTSVGICFLYLLLAMIVAVGVYHWKLHVPGRESRLFRWTQSVNRKFRKPAFSLFLFAAMHQHKLSFLFTKLAACSLIILTAKLYGMGGYDNRLISIALSVAGLTQVVLVYYFHYFENVELALQKNMPFPLSKKFSRDTLTLFVLLLPEIAVFTRYFFSYLPPVWVVQGVFLILSITLLLYSYLYIRSIIIEIFIRRVFFLLLLYFFSIMFKIPVLLLVIINTLVACFLFVRCYYSFEYELLSDVND